MYCAKKIQFTALHHEADCEHANTRNVTCFLSSITLIIKLTFQN